MAAAGPISKVGSIDPVIIEAFFAAVINGDVETVKDILEKNKEHVKELVEARNKLGMTPLLWACSDLGKYSALATASGTSGKCEIVNILLQNGADVGTESPQGDYPLSDILRTFSIYLHLQSGYHDSDDDKAIVCSNYDKIIKILLNNGAKVKSGTKSVEVLSSASVCGYLEIVKECLSLAKSVTERNNIINSPLMFSAIYGRLNIVEYLVQTCGVPANGYRFSPLSYASQKGHLKVVQFLIEHGAEIYPKSKSSHDNALTSAYEYNQPEIVRFLLTKIPDGEKDEIINILLQNSACVSLGASSSLAVLKVVLQAVTNEKTIDYKMLMNTAFTHNMPDVVEYLADILARKGVLYELLLLQDVCSEVFADDKEPIPELLVKFGVFHEILKAVSQKEYLRPQPVFIAPR